MHPRLVVWGPVVWDSNRDSPKAPNNFHFAGAGIPNIQTHQDPNHQFTISWKPNFYCIKYYKNNMWLLWSLERCSLNIIPRVCFAENKAPKVCLQVGITQHNSINTPKPHLAIPPSVVEYHQSAPDDGCCCKALDRPKSICRDGNIGWDGLRTNEMGKTFTE